MIGNQAVPQAQLHAGRHGQNHQRHGDQQQGHQVVLPFLRAPREGRQRQAQGAEQGRDGHQGDQHHGDGHRRRQPETRQLRDHHPAGQPDAQQVQYGGEDAEEHDGQPVCRPRFRCAPRDCTATFPTCPALSRPHTGRRPDRRPRSTPRSTSARAGFSTTARHRAGRRRPRRRFRPGTAGPRTSARRFGPGCPRAWRTGPASSPTPAERFRSPDRVLHGRLKNWPPDGARRPTGPPRE